MNTTGEAADQVVRMMLNSSEVLLRLTGSGAKNVAALLYAIYKGEKKTKGAERLTNMLRSGKQLRVYTFESQDLEKFKECAKQYGIVYTVLKEKDKTDGVFDVFVHADDDNKMARIIERFNLAKVDTATLRSEIIKEKEERGTAKSNTTNASEKEVPEKEQSQEKYEEGVVEKMFSEKPIQKEEQTQGNPTMARTDENKPDGEAILLNTAFKNKETAESESLFEPKSKKSKETSQRSSDGERISVIAEIAKIKKEIAEEKKQEAKMKDTPELPKIKTNKEKER